MRLEDGLAGGHDSARPRSRPIIESYPGAVTSLTQQGVTGRVLLLAAHQGRQELPLKYFNLRFWKSSVGWRGSGWCWPVLTFVFIPTLNRVNYGWYYGCFLRDMLDTLTIVISWVKILEIVTRHFAIVPKENVLKWNPWQKEQSVDFSADWTNLLDLMPNRIGSSLFDFFTCHLKMSNFRLNVEKNEVCRNFSFIFSSLSYHLRVDCLGNISFSSLCRN